MHLWLRFRLVAPLRRLLVESEHGMRCTSLRPEDCRLRELAALAAGYDAAAAELERLRRENTRLRGDASERA